MVFDKVFKRIEFHFICENCMVEHVDVESCDSLVVAAVDFRRVFRVEFLDSVSAK